MLRKVTIGREWLLLIGVLGVTLFFLIGHISTRRAAQAGWSFWGKAGGLIGLIENWDRPQEEDDLSGVYYADYKLAKEKLVLKKDGAYLQEVFPKNGEKAQSGKGFWVFHPAAPGEGSGTVDLKGDYVDLQREHNLKTDRNNAHPRPEAQSDLTTLDAKSIFGIVRLYYGSEFGYRRKWGSENNPEVAFPAKAEVVR
jgi:hypothetical protein